LDTGVIDAFASVGGRADRHQSIVDARPGVAHSALTATVKKERMNNEISQVADALPGMAWTALPHRDVDSLCRNACNGRGEEFLMAARSLVAVVDDDESVRESLPDLLRELGFTARAFSSAEEFLASDCVGQTRCLVLDIAMPGMSGPELQQELKRRRENIPIIFITAHRDEAIRPRLLEQGAVECLFKPFSDTALLDALNAALRTA